MTKNNSLSIFIILILLFYMFQLISAKDIVQNIKKPIDTSQVISYTYPRLSPKSTDYNVKVNNKEVFVYKTSAAPFAAFACNGVVNVEIEMPNASKNVTISPIKNDIKPVVNGKFVSFQLSKPMSVVVEVDGMPQLFIYANPINPNPLSDLDRNVRFFKSGQIYEVGELSLKDNESLYIEGGAIVRGCIKANSAKNIRISGSGILDGSYFHKGIDEHKSILLENCQNSIIEDVIIIEPSSWMIVLNVCQDVTVRNVKELSSLLSTDGVDIVSSKKIYIENCFFRNADDCVAIKSLNMKKLEIGTLDYNQDVEDIEIRGCSFLAYAGGQALEIGHELSTVSVSNIRFIDCDILGVHGFCGVFGIHNSDRAIISNILYENIRVEHFYDKLIDIRVIKSRYTEDEQRGQICDIVFKNIDVTVSKYNPGYSISIIGGYDSKHTVQNVLFDNFTLNGVKVLNTDQLDLFTKQAFNIKFK